MNKLKLIIYTLVISLLLQSGGFAMAAMQSSSYVIYENIHHSFDGPVITNVADSVDEITATITWETSAKSDSYVIYDTDNTFATSHEQGQGVKNKLNHSVDVTGLDESTTYYYKVKSTRINGGTTIDSVVRSFTTGVVDTGEAVKPSGGGVLIIDKTDKLAPEITDIKVTDISNSGATINWTTNEDATAFVEYGQSGEYESTYGSWDFGLQHSVVLENLDDSRRYYFRAISSDDWGNVGYSDELDFVTLSPTGEEVAKPTEKPAKSTTDKTDPMERIREFLGRLFPQVALNNMGDDFLSNVGTLDDLANFVPAPILSGEPRVKIGATEVTISWVTDVDSNSLVAMAPETAYHKGADEPYRQIVGNSTEFVQGHEVTLYNLKPNTTYHYQLRSKASFGPEAKSRDFTFTTSIEELTIISFLSQVIDTETANFKWVTNKAANSVVTFSPIQNNVVAVDEQKVVKEDANITIHEIKIKDFVAGVIYNVELSSTDAAGNVATETLERFSTSEEDLPPIISHIKADSTIFIDKNNKIQTVISWITNEPSTSKILFQEGVHGSNVDLSETTKLNTNYTKEHVMVINKFKPGVVYSFRVESIDSGNNVTESQVHTFMTAKKKDSIIDIIMKILEDTFGWVKKLM